MSGGTSVLADLLDPPAKRIYRTPGALAKALNPKTRQTPALDLIDAELVGVAEGRCERLIICMPPQEGKSTRISRYGILWMLYRNPNLRVVLISYGEEMARHFSRQIRGDITTFDGTEGLTDLGLRIQADSRAVGNWRLALPAQGGLYAIGLYGSITGKPVDLLVIDDPVKDFRAADSELLSEQAWQTWMAVARPRLAPNAPVVVVLTRWHEQDLAGRLLAKQAEDEAAGVENHDRWKVINIPAQADHDIEKGEADILGRKAGEFMISVRGRTREQWEATKAATAPRIWTSLYQGRPSPEAGDVFQRTWWKRYDIPPWTREGTSCLVPDGELVQSWDMTFKDTSSSDYVVGQVWLRRGADAFLVDQVRARMTFTETITALQSLTAKWPQTTAKLVEDKANGPAVIDSLKKEIGGLIPVNPGKDSKTGRARAVSPFVESGNVHLPTERVALFNVESLIEECASFPNGAHDDQVDALSQALKRLLLHAVSAQAEAFHQLALERLAQTPLEVVQEAREARERLARPRALVRCPSPQNLNKHLYRGDVCALCGQVREAVSV
jgi:predicted phage terminase large subunit-like protein